MEIKCPVRVFTTRIPHHSSHSGYEQLVRFLPEREVFAVERISNRGGWRMQVERILRRFAANKWYMWDGIVSEWNAWKFARKQNAMLHFLYGDHTIGLLSYVRKYLKSPIVLTIHACPSDLPEIFQHPSLLRQVDHFILLGSNQEHFFRKLGIPNSRMSVVPHGVDLDFFKPDPSAKKNRKTVLIVGNWRRNFPLYRKVIERMPDVSFRVVTAKYNWNWFDGLDEKRVACQSGISDAALLREYQQADTMLLAMTDAVANNVLLEALACGLPVVSERIGAVPEYLGSDYPFFFDQDDEKGAVKMLQKVLNEAQNPSFFRELSLTFDWKKVADQTQSVYRLVKPLY